MNIIVYRNCFTGDVSGGDMHMAGVLHWLAHRGDDQLSLVFARGDGQSKTYEDVAHVRNLTYPAPKVRLPALLYIFRALLGWWLPRLPYDDAAKNVLIASSHFLPDVLPVSLKMRSRPIERVVYIHHIVGDMPRRPGLATTLAHLQEKFCFYLIKKHFDKIIVVNQAVKRRLLQLGFKHHLIQVSSNFASSQPLPPRELEQKEITLLFCGRLVKQKGVDDFLDVCRFLQQELPAFRAVMAGAGPESGRLKAVIADEKLPVELVGRVSEAEKFELYARAQLFVFPSIEEGWGIVVAEALAAGTPVLAYDLPVYREIFNDNLHVIPEGSTRKLQQEALSLLQRYSLQPQLYKQEQQRIADFAERFTKANVARAEYLFLTS